ncbi:MULTISPECIES: TetR/AcrR family transcriptional regulator [Kribbella]|uniref:TetR family transcriptional regulator n=1 Tax=Kribbella pratensis TaxID=2512112 RepID=A0ABY2FN22_9ACTN|nr:MULTISPECIES: TetR/AcrR family transcriptional regulator [Kribbella]TDW94328.1 TetR family transcriptional regulator [Kribbella pratensis]TDX02932.1 TetR family transcriptional regulator [Kribbella sp. VKM Ac-2566]
MAEPVKTYRQVQAEETRIRIAQAARRLFAAQGYGATSIDAIAKEAGVATRTVYSAFGTKREILSLICDQWLSEAGAIERAGQVFAIEGPAERLRGAAGWLTNLYAAGFDVVLIFEAATDESPETKALLRSKLAGRNEVMDAMIASLESELRIPLKQAQAVYRALAAPGVYQELVDESGWTPAEFERFVADSLERQLL